MATPHMPATAAQVPQAVLAFVATLSTALAAVVALYTPVYNAAPSKRYYYVVGLLWAMATKATAKAGHAQGAAWYAQAAMAHACNTGACYTTAQGTLAPWAARGGLTLANGKVGSITPATLAAAFTANVPNTPSNANGMLGLGTATQARKGQAPAFFATVQSAGGMVALYNTKAGHAPITKTFGGAPVPVLQ